MSAYIVSRGHINYLVNAAAAGHDPHGPPLRWWYMGEWRTLQRSDLETELRIGQTLWDENILSVQHRYDDEPVDQLPGPIDERYTYDRFDYVIGNWAECGEPGQVFAACDCYEYQACEHDDWEDSEAFAILKAIRKKWMRRASDAIDAGSGAPEVAELAVRPDADKAIRAYFKSKRGAA